MCGKAYASLASVPDSSSESGADKNGGKLYTRAMTTLDDKEKGAGYEYRSVTE
ncbi:hypothetical protein [Gordoniibacillus kamchatkensis]|uniref:hypothetical protein n=1 Tax=Gordoniibacillus kamchatkensis TaxID=1590651 RepID=UPI000A921E6F|nr:hypothetical protein [Paenibacillus sp. VKM B-2647]